MLQAASNSRQHRGFIYKKHSSYFPSQTKVITEVLYEVEAESWLNTRSLSYDRIRPILCTSHDLKINIVEEHNVVVHHHNIPMSSQVCPQAHSFPPLDRSPCFSTAAHLFPVQRPIMSLAGRLDRAIADEHIGLYENRMQNKKPSKRSLQSKFLLQHSIYYDSSSEHENLLNW